MRSILVATLLALIGTTGAKAQVQSHLLVVSGLGGEPRYVEDFIAWGTAMVEAATNRFQVPPENVTYLAEDPARNPSLIDGESTKAEVEAALRAIAARAGPDDRVMILLIGHGGFDDRGARLNLPGPDITAADFATLLEPLQTQSVVVVNSASASGAWQEPLAGPNRTIITATRAGNERNETVFGRYFVEAYRGDGADANRDGRITLDEAFAFATRETERSYTNAGTLQLEHSRIEGNEQLTQTFHLGSPRGEIADASPELQALYNRKTAIEDTLAALRARRDQMEAAAYEAELERVLLELARTNRSIQEMEGGSR